MNQPDRVIRLQGRSPAIGFIDERLPQHDPAFLNAPSVFDNASGRYLPILPAHPNEVAPGQHIIANVALSSQSFHGQVVVPDQTYQTTEAQSMSFWNGIFAEAMSLLLAESEEPKVLAKLGRGIRNADGWEAICFRLNEAQIAYTGEEGTSGTLKRMRRRVADNIPSANIVKMVPDIDPWSTPVAGTIGLLLQAITIAAKTRQDVLTRLSDLDKTFSNIDSFAATFPKDQNVKQASVSLVVAIFQAVEQAMSFFAKSSGRKSAAAILTGSDYQKELLNSFNEVEKRSDYLVQKAQNSHYEATRAAMQEILTCENRLLAGQAEAAKHSADRKNMILSLLQVYVRERELDRKQHQEELRRRDEIQKEQDAIHRRNHQELIALLQRFQMVQHPVSPLPTPIARLTPPPSSTQPLLMPSFPVWEAQTLLQLLGVPDVSASDLMRVNDLANTLSQNAKRKADRVVQTELFRRWMKSLKPAKLLIQGDFRGSRTVSPLSLITTTLTEAARADPIRFVTLVFFCACHLDPEEDAFTGGRALIQSLISQLLLQQPKIKIAPSPWELHPERVGQGDLQQLCQIFGLLVHRLPSEITLFCCIDGVVLYERDEFITEAQYVLSEILRLVGGHNVQANVKLLVTSPWRTEMMHLFFQDDHEVLQMQAMPKFELTPNSSHVVSRYMSHSESDSSRESSPEAW